MLNKYLNAENKTITILLLLSIVGIYLLIAFSAVTGVFGVLFYDNIGNLSLPCLLFFFLILVFSLLNETYFFFFLVFILLSFPSPVDDFFPSVMLSNFDDSNFAVFPLITRIDVYLIIGIFFKVRKQKFKIRYLKLPLLVKLFFLLILTSFFVQIVCSKDFLDLNLLLSYSFHIRYFILILILLSQYNIKLYYKPITYGFVFSLIFLLIEASLNSNIKGLERLTSGSLSLNTFANISSSIMLYIYFLRKERKVNKFVTYFVFVIFLLIVLGSGTRGAFLTLVVSLVFVRILENPQKIFTNLLKVTILTTAVISIYIYTSNKKMIAQRYSYEYLSSKIDIDVNGSTLKDIFKIKQSWETNSLNTRLDLFDSSLNMISENPIFGIGPGRWNRYKNTYSDKDNKLDKILLDSHNDYLALLSQYGILLGLLMSFLIFFYPMKLFKYLKHQDNPLKYLYVICFSMGIAAITNSGFFKHQVAAILFLCLGILINLYKNDYKEIC